MSEDADILHGVWASSSRSTSTTSPGRRTTRDHHHVCTMAATSSSPGASSTTASTSLVRPARVEVDIARARALGLNDLLSLSVRRRHPEMIPVAEAFDTCTGIGSALLDLTDDPERPGRWLPDTIGARHRRPLPVPPVLSDRGAEIPVIEQLVGRGCLTG